MGPPCLSADRYANNNSLQRKYANAVLEFCQPAFFADVKNTMQFLDVGCGTGDFTRDCLLPRCLPCRRIIAVDCSGEMIQYARQQFPHEKIEYHVLNIGEDVSNFIRTFGQFDRVYSFYCLQWLKDQGTALKNISNLLTTGGECLLVFPASQPPAMVWSLLAKMNRWAKYSEELLAYASKSHYMNDKEEQIHYMSSLLEDAGLSSTIFVLPRVTLFDGCSEEDIIGMHMGVLPINRLVPDTDRAQLLADVTALVRQVHGPQTDQSRFRMYVIMATKKN